MGQISNRILISSVNDGTTIHGSLRATKSLTQGWDGATCSPDWTVPNIGSEENPFYHPVIYLTLFNGSTQINPTTFKWYYNGIELTFSSTAVSGRYPSTNEGMENWFLKSHEDPDGASGIAPTECLTLNHNLAGENNNLDIDLVSIKGTVEVGGTQIPFEAGIDITLTKISSTGYLGVLSFTNGKSTLDGDNDYVTIRAYLYKNGSLVNANSCKFMWEKNGTALSGSRQSITVYGREVTDIATFVCKFYHNPNGTTTDTSQYLQYTSVAVVDDVGDPEYLYIRYTIGGEVSNNDGAPVSLHSGQYVTYKMWVAKSDNSNGVISSFNKFYVQPHNAAGTLINGSSFGKAQSPDVTHTSANLRTGTYSVSGFVEVTGSTTTDNGTSVTGGVFAIDYPDTAWNGGNISLIVVASEE